jgi:hypothetical protein
MRYVGAPARATSAARAVIKDVRRQPRQAASVRPRCGGQLIGQEILEHYEYRGQVLPFGLRDLPVDKTTKKSKAPMHKSVYQRFEAGPVVLFDRLGLYRPPTFFCHVDFAQYFDGSSDPQPAADPQCVADDIETKWENLTVEPL